VSAVVAALLAALCFALASVLQHSAASAADSPDGATALRLTAFLLGRPLWLLGLVAGGVGLVLHAAALQAGAVAVVQPLLASGLVFALVLGAAAGRPTGSAQWLAAAGTVVGLGLFLVSAHPGAGTARAHGPVLAIGTATALVLCVLARYATRRPGVRHRALLLAAASGTGFGITGALLKQVVGTPATQLPLTWPPYALVVLGVAAVTLSQAAYQAGSLVECLPAMTVLEPVVAVIVGATAFSEALASSRGAQAGQVAGLLLMGAAVAWLAALQARSERAATVSTATVSTAAGSAVQLARRPVDNWS